MPVTIEFLGLCLFDFCSDRDDLRVLLPNAINANGHRHIDNVGRAATPHYAMFPEFEDGQRVTLQRLWGSTVRFPALQGARPKRPASSSIAHLSQFTRNLTLKPDRELENSELVACSLLLSGGRLVPSAPGRFRDYSFDSVLKPGHVYRPKLAPAVAWKIAANEIEMVIESGGAVVGTRVLRAARGLRYAIGNIDDPLPEAWPTPRAVFDQDGRIVDEDFKWHYRLFDPPARDWQALLEGKALPVPVVRRPPRARGRRTIRAAGAPTCHCAMC